MYNPDILALLEIITPPKADLTGWLQQQSQYLKKPILLAHADDGVVWGYWDEKGNLHLSGEAFPVTHCALRLETLQQARLFAQNGEVLLWNAAGEWRARRILDGADISSVPNALEEEYLLWGDSRQQHLGFTLMEEGIEGLRHAPPIEMPGGQRAALVVRHYLDADKDGQVFIAFSRLVRLAPLKGGAA